jgi:hypothetical protein
VKNKKAIIFDLDGTLSESKQLLDTEMAELLAKLVSKYFVAIISGGAFPQFENQVLSNLKFNHGQLEKLILMPTSGATLYRYNNESWEVVYENKLTKEEVAKIREALIDSLKRNNIIVEIERDMIEDRGNQVTFSIFGQNAPLELKKTWDPNHEKRQKIIAGLNGLDEFEIHIGGTTSIDITKKGIDKAYGVNALSKILNTPIEEMLFVGDALYPGGNDASALRTGIESKTVSSVQETKDLIRELISV